MNCLHLMCSKLLIFIINYIYPINAENYSGVYEILLIRANGWNSYYILNGNQAIWVRKGERVADIK